VSIEAVRDRDGQVVKRGGATVYRVRWREGTRNRSRVVGRKRDAQEFDAAIRHRQRTAGYVTFDAGRQTVAEWTGEWWDRHAEPSLKRSTLTYYAWLLDRHLMPRVGNMRLAEMSPAAIVDLRGDLERSGVPAATAAKALTLLGGILKGAVEDGRIDRNPVHAVRKPRVPRRRAIRPLAPETIETIRGRLRYERRGTGGLPGTAASLGHRDATLVALLAYAGLRPRSEALALCWADVRERTLLVHATKTGRTRTVRLLAPLARDLAEWRMRCGRPAETELVFPHAAGEWSEHSYRRWRAKVYEPVAIACGVEKDSKHPYALRHSCASLLIAEGQSVVEVAGQLGHSPSMCLSTYSHVIAEFDPAERKPAEDRIRAAREDSVPAEYLQAAGGPT
jgi:integrase